MSAHRLVDRAAARNPFPEGTLAVGAGLLLSGVSAYAFLSISARVLGEDDFAPLSLLWFTTFILAPGFFLPIEQEVGRALAHRRALSQGGLPVIRKAGALGLGLIGIIALVIVLLGPVLVDHLFHGYWAMVPALLLAFSGYALAHFARGVFAGSGRFGPYGVVMGAEGVVRVALALVLAAAGVDNPVAYGLLVGLPPFTSVALAMRGQRGHLQEGPAASLAELTPNLGWLLIGSVLAAALVNAGPIAANVLADDGQESVVSQFAYGVLIARVPLFLFQAVQAALLPKLARLAAQGALDEFVRGFRKLLIAVVGVAAVGVVGAFLFGPLAVEVFFDSELSRRTVTLLALGSALYMIAVAMAQALIALQCHARVAAGWAIAMTSFLVAVAVASDDLLLRVELALVCGSLGATVAFAVFLVRAIRRGGVAPDEATLIEAMYDLPVEP